MDQLIRSIASSAPVAYRRELQLGADPQLRADLAAVRARPRSIRRLPGPRAVAVVELIDDPELLAAVRAEEKRLKVSNEIANHPLHTKVPHHRWCADCRAVTSGVSTTGELTADPTVRSCRLVPVRRIELTDDAGLAERCWQQLLGDGDIWQTTAARAALRVKVAGGAFDPVPAWVTAELSDQVTWREGQIIAELVARLGTQTVDTVRLWRHASRSLPPGTYDAALLKMLATELPDPEVVSYGIDQAILTAGDLTELWPHIRVEQKVKAVLAFPEEPFLSWALTQLAADEEWAASTGTGKLDHAAELLSARPDLTTAQRLVALTPADCDVVVSFAIGDYRAAPRPGEVRAAAEQLLAAKDHRWILVDRAKRCSERVGLDPAGMSELADYLIDTAQASLLLTGTSPLAARAHDRLWSALGGDAQRVTALGLLRGWNGTIPDLITTVTLLEAAA